jgi:hypothetical protein
MRSAIAALRTLVLPFGAITGPRIVLNGTAGVIEVYDGTGALVAEIAPGDGFKVFGADDTFARIFANSSVNPKLQLAPTEVGHVFGPGEIQADEVPQLTLISPTIDGGDAARLRVRGATTGGDSARVRVDDDFEVIGSVLGTLKVNADGANDPDIRVGGISLPRGTLDLVQQTGNVTLSTTAGTYTTVLTGNAVDLLDGRTYKITLSGGDFLTVAGSGFATTNSWDQRPRSTLARASSTYPCPAAR